ncbi:transposase [Spectribacter hydrogenoxidans]|uniref:Transposase n=1 Tax=Spectribacter hydrogenoxidans TaxID=3075608 RepID=A0ABU3C2R8_9GAMM|nr:transposase [Salinisphaera sp. W335]MDT0635838.1 transposase [Salinisphaera sp. W335]
MESITSPRVFGCDVGQDTLVVFDSQTGQHTELANQPAALAAFVTTLGPDSLVVCEATGGHEAALLAATVEAGVPAHRADARKVKAFIRSLGRLAKTDRIDAQGLARYGRERADQLVRWQPPDADRQALQSLVRLRRELVAQRTAHQQRLKAPALRQRYDIIQAIPGCGPVAATALVALLPELGQANRRGIAALAPHPRQSGKTNGYRRVRGGRPEVRQALFMVALAASRHHPTLQAFYNRLVANGKKKIVAITAVMRKLITIINARIRDAEHARLDTVGVLS